MAPEIAATGGAPGFYRDEEHVDTILHGPIGEKVSQIAREKTGVEFVAYGEVGFRHLLTKEPIANLEELSDTKIRVPELAVWADFWRLLGANPAPLPYAEQVQRPLDRRHRGAGGRLLLAGGDAPLVRSRRGCRRGRPLPPHEGAALRVLIAVGLALVLLGVPIAFAMVVAVFAAFVPKNPLILVTISQNMASTIDSFVLMAIPSSSPRPR